jgi:hypothetical protein
LWIRAQRKGKSSLVVSIGKGTKVMGVAETEQEGSVNEWVMVKLESLDEGTVVGEVLIPLQVGTFGDCEEGGSLCSHIMICK